MRKKRWENRLAQFGYDHRNLEIQLEKAKKSADELSKILNNMPPKSKEKEEKKENKKK